VDLARPLTPHVLGLIAVVANPDLKAARARAAVAQAQLFAAGLLPDPSFTFSYDALLSGPDMANGLGAQLVYELTALRDRGVMLAGARAARDQVRLDLAWQEWQTAGQARLLAARIAGLEASVPQLDAARRAADDALTRVLAAAARGDLKAEDVAVRRLAAADAAERSRLAERDLASARQDLNRLLGLAPSARLVVSPDPPAAPPPDADTLFALARTTRLDLKALEAGYRSQEAAVRKAALDAFPSLQLTLAAARDTADNRTVGPAVNFTLPVWNRNAGGIAIARATRAQLAAEFAARVFATRADITAVIDALAADRRRRTELAAQAAPLERLAVETEAAAARGDVSRAAAEAARQSAVDKSVAIAALDQAMAEQGVALELAVGTPLTDRARRGRVP
jgi:outer membrane protein TolC